MKIVTSNRKAAVIVIITNLMMIFVNIFVFPLILDNSKIIAFSNIVSKEANKSLSKKIPAAIDINEIENKTKYNQYKNMKHSLKSENAIVSLNKNINEKKILFGQNIIETTVLLQNNIYASKRENGFYRIETTNLWYLSEPIFYSVGESKRNISISENIARQLFEYFGVDDYVDLGGREIVFSYHDSSGVLKTELMFIRGVFSSKMGNMPTYQDIYGDNIVLFYENYFDLDNVESHIYLDKSGHKTKFNLELLIGFGLTNIQFREGNNGTKSNEYLQQTFEQKIDLTNVPRAPSKIILCLLFWFFSIIACITTIIFLVVFETKTIFTFYIFPALLISEFARMVLFLFDNKFLIQVFLNPYAGLFTIAFIFVSSIITILLKNIKVIDYEITEQS